MSETKPYLSITEIQKRMPHRFPFLLIDRVLSFEHGPDPKKYVGRKVVARKNVTMNTVRRFSRGHDGCQVRARPSS